MLIAVLGLRLRDVLAVEDGCEITLTLV